MAELCVVVGDDLAQGQRLMTGRDQGRGHGFQPGLPMLGPLSLRLHPWLPGAAPQGWSETKQRLFCGAQFLRIAVAGLQEVSPIAYMSWDLLSEVSLCLLSEAQTTSCWGSGDHQPTLPHLSL